MTQQEKKKIKIYILTNKVNGKQYVGFSNNPEKRFIAHCDSKYKIGLAIRKHGQENFSIQILEEEYDNRNDAGTRESELIEELNSRHPGGYNLTKGGEGFDSETASRNSQKLIAEGRHAWQNGDRWNNMTEDDRKYMIDQMKIGSQRRWTEDACKNSPFTGGDIQRAVWAKRSPEEKFTMMSERWKKHFQNPNRKKPTIEQMRANQLKAAASRKGKKNSVSNPKKCGSCGETGHYKSTCPKRHSDESSS